MPAAIGARPQDTRRAHRDRPRPWLRRDERQQWFDPTDIGGFAHTPGTPSIRMPLMPAMTRRRFLRAGLATGAGLALSPIAARRLLAQSHAPHGSASTATPAPIPTSPLPPIDLPQPQAVRSADGILRTTLRAVPAEVDMRAAEPVRTWTYDGLVPGRTWELAPGETLSFDVVNDLPPLEHAEPPDPNRPHEWSTTNIHTHGLHVSPRPSAAGHGDDVFLSIPPGERLHYDIPVPADHTGGLFWYHPHRHGGVAQQVRAGMSGAIVIRGPIDEVDEVRAAKEQLLILQAIELGDDFGLLDPIPHPSTHQSFFPRTQILYTVNGVLTPRVTLHPGEVRRWRILNAAEGTFMSLRLEGHDLLVLAWDGLTLPAPQPTRDLLIPSGGRAEVLVKAGPPGAYALVLTPGSSQRPDIPGMPPSATGSASTAAEPPPISSSELEPRAILTVEVSGSGPEMGLPTGLPAFDPPMLAVARQRVPRRGRRRPHARGWDRLQRPLGGPDGRPPARDADRDRVG
jgi:FtsP/CotA-like multicopper oxidase with cupredoxin domain